MLGVLFFKDLLFSSYVLSVLPSCKCVHLVPAEARRGLDPLELEF